MRDRTCSRCVRFFSSSEIFSHFWAPNAKIINNIKLSSRIRRTIYNFTNDFYILISRNAAHKNQNELKCWRSLKYATPVVAEHSLSECNVAYYFVTPPPNIYNKFPELNGYGNRQKTRIKTCWTNFRMKREKKYHWFWGDWRINYGEYVTLSRRFSLFLCVCAVL